MNTVWQWSRRILLKIWEKWEKNHSNTLPGCAVYICMSYMRRLETTQQLSVVSAASNNKIMVHSWNWNDGAFQLDFHEAIQSKFQFKKRLFSHHSFGHSLFSMVWKKKLQPPTDIRSRYLRCMKKRSHQGAGPFSASVKFWTTTATKINVKQKL